MASNRADFLVVGGGIAGASVAYELTRLIHEGLFFEAGERGVKV
jgi:glycine/D-amino acid oxidase-like deaminating enzyme